MVWTPPATWSVGESPTATKLNANIRDNMLWLHDSIPCVALANNAAQTIPNATWTTVTFDYEITDVSGMHDSGSNTSRITVDTGVYLFTATGAFEAASNSVALGVRFLYTATAFQTSLVPGCGQDGNGPSIAQSIPFGGAAYVELQVWQNSGGDLDTAPGISGVSFGAARQ